MLLPRSLKVFICKISKNVFLGLKQPKKGHRGDLQPKNVSLQNSQNSMQGWPTVALSHQHATMTQNVRQHKPFNHSSTQETFGKHDQKSVYWMFYFQSLSTDCIRKCLNKLHLLIWIDPSVYHWSGMVVSPGDGEWTDLTAPIKCCCAPRQMTVLQHFKVWTPLSVYHADGRARTSYSFVFQELVYKERCQFGANTWSIGSPKKWHITIKKLLIKSTLIVL